MATNLANLARVSGSRMENFELHPPKDPREIIMFFSSGLALHITSVPDEDDYCEPLETTLVGENYDMMPETIRYIDNAIKMLGAMQDYKPASSGEWLIINNVLEQLSRAKVSARKDKK